MSDSNSQTEPTSTGSSPHYWCHHCGREVSIYMAPDPTCQVCNEQFIEEIDDAGDDPRAFLAGGTDNNNTNNNNDTSGDEDVFQFFGGGAGATGRRFQFTTDGLNQQQEGEGGGGTTMNAMLQGLLSNILSGVNGTGNNTDDNGNEGNNEGDTGNNNTGQQQQRRRTPMIFYSGGMMDGNMQFRPIHLHTNTGDGQQTEGGTTNAFFQFGGGDGQDGNGNENETGRGEGRTGLANNLEGIFQLISAMTGAPVDAAGLAGNPNDYVFSQGALDNIITQLMEQTGGRTAPPPAPEDVIDGLPKRVLSEQEFNNQVDCAVCKDEFSQSEMVIELPCQHLFHDDCIKPWLKMNGTCPVCRHSVLPESTEGNGNHGDDTTSSSQGQDNTTSQSHNTNSNQSNNETSNNDSTGDSNSTSSSQNTNNIASTAYAWFNRSFTPSNNNSSQSNNQQTRSQQQDNDVTAEMDLDLD